MLLSEVVSQFIVERTIARYSLHTISDYSVIFILLGYGL